VVVSDSGGLAELAARGPSVRIVRAGDVRSLGRALRQGLDMRASSVGAL